MADDFDPYREALVMEILTIWPDEYDTWEPEEKARVEARRAKGGHYEWK